MVCLVFLPLLAIHTSDFPSNIIRCACYGPISGSMLISSILIIIKFHRSITAYHAALYSLEAPGWATAPGTCVQ